MTQIEVPLSGLGQVTHADFASYFLPWFLAVGGSLAFGKLPDLVGTPVGRRSDTETKLWGIGATIFAGIASYFSWRLVLAPEGTGIGSFPRIAGGVAGTLFGFAAAISLFSHIFYGSFSPERADAYKALKRLVRA